MGAEPADATRARLILEQLCRRLEYAGPVGSGSVLKFTINLPLMVYWQALGEALAMARSVAIEPERLMDLLSDTSGTANVLKVRAPGIASMLKGGAAGAVTFDVDSAIKDMQSMLAEAKSRGIELPLVERTLGCYQETREHRSGSAEISTVSVYWAGRNHR
jgi:3-hydroxyisobutyrate dehydrogenase